MGEVALLQERHLETPECGGAVPPEAASAATRALRLGPVGLCGRGERADPELVAAAPLVDGFSGRQELVGCQARNELPEGIRFPIWICTIRPNAHPEGVSPNKEPGGRSGKLSVWLGRAQHSGSFRSPNHRLLSKLLDWDIKNERMELPKEVVDKAYARDLLLFSIEIFDDRLVGYTNYSMEVSRTTDKLFQEIADQ